MGYNAFMSVTTKWYGDKEKKDMNTAMIRTLNKGVIIVQADAVLTVPVDTSLLKGSIDKDVNNSKLIGQVGTNTEYAGYVEFGTSKQKAQPYLRPALIKNSDKIIQIAKQEGAKSVGS